MPRKRMTHHEILNSLHDRIGGIHLENPRRVEPAGFLVDLVGVLVAMFGLALGAYLVYIQLRM